MPARCRGKTLTDAEQQRNIYIHLFVQCGGYNPRNCLGSHSSEDETFKVSNRPIEREGRGGPTMTYPTSLTSNVCANGFSKEEGG